MARITMTARQFKEAMQLDSRLQEMLVELTATWPAQQMVVTSVHRTANENEQAGARSQIHVVGPPYRAVDLRIRNIDGDFQRIAEEIAEDLNDDWAYDPDRPDKPVAFARVHGSGPHIHLQVHPRTTRRG